MAPGCDDVIRDLRIVGTVEEALSDCHRAVATTARHRRGDQAVLGPTDFAVEHWSDPDPSRTTALLFGREDFGLSREHVDLCHAVLRIPTPEHASLNLAQAVLLIANHWFGEGLTRGVEPTGRPLGGRRGVKLTRTLDRASQLEAHATVPQLADAASELVRLLERVGYTGETPPHKVHQTALATLQRASLSLRQTHALRGMVSKIERALDNPEPRDP